jgi:outer membrane protein, heavy metal efflux system
MLATIFATAALAGVAVGAGPVPSGPGIAPAAHVPPASGSATSSGALARDSGGTLVLTRQQAVSRALAQNPQLRAAQEQVSQARARVWEAVALPDPAFAGAYEEETAGFLHPNSSTSRDVGVAFTIPFPDKLRLSGKAAHSDLRATEFSYTQTSQQIASATAQAYDALVVALRHEQDLSNDVQLADDFLQKTQARFAGGTVAGLDVVKAKVDRAQAQNALIASQLDLANARAGLNRLLARELGAPIQPADSLAMPGSPPGLDSLRALAVASRPDLQGLAAERQSARASAGLAKEWWLPDISLTLSRNYTQGDPAAVSTGIGIGLPLFFWQHHWGEVAEAKHRVRELDADNRDLLAEVDQEVRAAYATASTAIQQAAYIRDELLPETQQAYDIASTSYGLGGSSALEVLDAKRSLIDAQMQYADALGAANDAMAQLQLAVGAPLDSTASSGGTHE